MEVVSLEVTAAKATGMTATPTATTRPSCISGRRGRSDQEEPRNDDSNHLLHVHLPSLPGTKGAPGPSNRRVHTSIYLYAWAP